MKHCKTEISDVKEQSEEVWRAVTSRAFALFANGGRRHGRDLEDWLIAERQLQSFNADPRITEQSGRIVIRAHIAVEPGTDLVVSLSQERVLIFRATASWNTLARKGNCAADNPIVKMRPEAYNDLAG